MPKNEELLTALDKLDALFSDESKWTKGAYVDPAGGCYCIVGGVLSVDPENGMDSPMAHELYKTATEGTNGMFTLERWNDMPYRTFADIKKLIADTRARIEAGNEV